MRYTSVKNDLFAILHTMLALYYVTCTLVFFDAFEKFSIAWNVRGRKHITKQKKSR